MRYDAADSCAVGGAEYRRNGRQYTLMPCRRRQGWHWLADEVQCGKLRRADGQVGLSASVLHRSC